MSAAISAVEEQLAGALSEEAFVALQTALLSSLNSSAAADGVLSDEEAQATASLVLAVVVAGATLDPAAQNTALEALGSVAAQSNNVSAAVAQTIASAVLAVLDGSGAALNSGTQNRALGVLFAVATSSGISSGLAQTVTSALSAVATSAVVSNPAALTQVQVAVNTLAGGLLAALTTPGGAAVAVTSPLINLSVALDVTGAGSRLFSAPLTAPGSASSFDPLPPDIFSGSSGVVRSLFTSLAFDPHAAANNGVSDTSAGRSCVLQTSSRLSRSRCPRSAGLPTA